MDIPNHSPQVLFEAAQIEERVGCFDESRACFARSVQVCASNLRWKVYVNSCFLSPVFCILKDCSLSGLAWCVYVCVCVRIRLCVCVYYLMMMMNMLLLLLSWWVYMFRFSLQLVLPH
jgi:hypothetical protein